MVTFKSYLTVQTIFRIFLLPSFSLLRKHMDKFLRRVFFSFLFILLSNSNTYSNPDSVSVTLCISDNSQCFGFENYTKTIEHFDSTGKIIELRTNYFYGCEHILDTVVPDVVSHYYYTYDSLQRLIIFSVVYSNGGDSSESRSTFTHDVFGNISSTLNQSGPVGNLNNLSFDTAVYDSSNRIFKMYLIWNSTNMAWDTINTEYRQFDNLNRIIQSDIYNHQQNEELHLYNIYNIDSNLVSQIRSSLYSGIFDSTRVINSFDNLHNKIETWHQKWDTLQQMWINNSRNTFVYSVNGLLETLYSFGCSDSSCNDTLLKSYYSYDGFDRFKERNDSTYDNSVFYWSGYSYVYRNPDGSVNVEGYWEVILEHCDYSDRTIYSYNSSNQIIHTKRKRYTCDYFFTDCDYYTLGNDSMLVKIYYPFEVCWGDTVLPIITVAGGTPPYQYQWFPDTGILNSHSNSPHFVADTTRIYLLQVTDSLGMSQIDTFKINVGCYPTSIDEQQLNENNITIYPNPFIEETTIQVNNQSLKITCLLYDVKGEIKKSIMSNNSSFVIKKENLSPGIYFVSLFTNDKFIGNRKLIVE